MHIQRTKMTQKKKLAQVISDKVTILTEMPRLIYSQTDIRPAKNVSIETSLPVHEWKCPTVLFIDCV